MEPLTFSILISTRDRRDDLLLTLHKISALIDRCDTECVVFDDGSTDGTSDAVQQSFPTVTLRRNATSRGYIYCRNQMLNDTKAKFAVSLDDDAHFLSENPLQEIEEHFNNHPKCGVIAARIFWGKEAPQNTETEESLHRVKGFVGCGHAWRAAAWHEIPQYPEWFEFYGEEQFAALQLFKHGWQVHYLPQVLVHHRVNMKARKTMNGFGLRYRRSIRNDWHLYFLFYPMSKIPRRIGYSFWMQLKKAFSGHFNVIPPVARAIFDVAVSLPKYKQNRDALPMAEWKKFMALPETKIYWNPEK